MENLDNVKYEKIDLMVYENRKKNLLANKKLQSLGFKIVPLVTTTYGYNLEMFSIGKGAKEIFIVGGTHSSEIITVDYVTQLVEQIPNFEEFDPNLFKINIIPIQNPEGFDINTNVIKTFDDSEFEQKSKEYYFRYKIDSLVYRIFESLNSIVDEDNFLSNLKNIINNNQGWIALEKVMPKLSTLNQKINHIDSQDKKIYQLELIKACNETIQTLDTKDVYLYEFINKLKSFFELLIERDLTKETKLHQEMFKNVSIDKLNIKNLKLKESLKGIYNVLPKGSIINHDSTGLNINLNSNQPDNPGIEIIKNNGVKYFSGVKSNIQNYTEGPAGLPCLDVNDFEYALENKVLYSLLQESYDSGKYLATFLYHGTGGLIFYKPSESMGEGYDEFLDYNRALADIYNEGISESINYKYTKIEKAENTGFGDKLRGTFPGVLLVELSKMGGNPIGPYGDKDNIYRTMNENFCGIKHVLGYFNQKKLKH